jgi:hypothetical protein
VIGFAFSRSRLSLGAVLACLDSCPSCESDMPFLVFTDSAGRLLIRSEYQDSQKPFQGHGWIQ